MMSGAYFFNGHLRWTFFWENPNCWAAFLACALAWVWFGQAGLRLKFKFKFQACALVVLYFVEASVWFLLVKTYSRGGLVAAVVAMVFFFVLHGLRGTGCQPVSSMGILPMRFVWHGRLARVFGNILARLALITVLCTAVGFASRMSPDYVAQDKSVINRVDQWKGAMVMIHDSPFHGWGHTLGGMMYQNWYQPLSHTTRPTGFVNSYLEVAMEQGSHVLFLVIVLTSALLLVAVRLRKVTWVVAAGASLVAWMTGNLWSSIWLWPGLWILPGIAVVCLIIAAFGIRKKLPGIIAISLAVGTVVWIAIVGAGHVLAKSFPFQAKPVAHCDATIVSRRGESTKSSELSTELWVDTAVTGRYWGKAIRTILGNNPCGKFIVYAPWALRENRIEQPASKCVYSGFQAELLADKNCQATRRLVDEKRQIIILYPTDYPPATMPASGHPPEITVCLPAFDASPYNLPWRRWAAENGAKLIFSPQDRARVDPNQNKEFWRSLLFNE